MSEQRRVVVTGLGLVTALGLGAAENWRRALAGECGIRALDGETWPECPIRAAGTVSDEDWARIAAAFPDDARREGERRTLFALHATAQALADAGVGAGGARHGVVLGAGLGIVPLEDVAGWLDAGGSFRPERLVEAPERISAASLLRNPSDRPAALVAHRFSLGGVNVTVTTACASASHAIGLAARMIRRGDADLVVAGGADSMINPLGLVYFALLGAAAAAPLPPQELCRPFDARRRGMVLGEGAGVVVLEAAEHAARRGARPRAEIAGFGTSLDGFRVTAPEPGGEGAARAMGAALADAGMAPDAIDYINAHGTGTRLNDAAETAAIKAVFGEHAARIPISASKPLIGHLVAACGGPELVFTVLATQDDAVHPTLNLTHPDPRCDLDYVPLVARRLPVRAALSNSFGFGGENACLVVAKCGHDQGGS